MAFDYKNASREELKKEYTRIAKETGDDQFQVRKELKYLPEILQDREQILAFASGMMDANTWLISLTDKRIIFLDKGMIYGLKQHIIELNKVNSISGDTGIVFGKIVVTHGSQSLKIEKVWKHTVKPFVNRALKAIDNRNSIQTNTTNNVDDKYSKLEKLHELKEKGILTEEEFQKEKIKVLSD